MPELPGPVQDLVPQLASRPYEDDWIAMGNSRERRRIQNRINQRVRRRYTGFRRTFMQVAESYNIGSRQRTGASASKENHSSRVVVRGERGPHPATNPVEATLANFDRVVQAINILDAHSEETQALIRAFEAFCYRNYLAHAPIPALLPSLVQFNITRALISNAEVLGLSPSQMDDEAISPFHASGPWLPSIRLDPASLPARLRPTDLQRATFHHPWLDLLPLPQMRDNLLRRGIDSFDEEELCCTLRGRGRDCSSGVLVWRDPWDASGWEVSEEFARSSWGWVIAGCWELYKSTNSWRAKRGENPLFIA